MKRRNVKSEVENPIAITVIKRSRFFHGLFSDPQDIIFNWTFYTSLILLTLFCIFNHYVFQTHLYNDTVVNFIDKYAPDLYDVSISAIGAIIASLAILLVIFDKRQLKIITKNDDKTFESFTFPYKWSVALWLGIILMSLIYNIVFKNLAINCKFIYVYYVYYYFFIFLLIYASAYMVYLIYEIMEYVLLSILLSNNSKK